MSDIEYKCKCGWTGSKLEKVSCVTYSDEWYVCPKCKTQDFNIHQQKEGSE